MQEAHGVSSSGSFPVSPEGAGRLSRPYEGSSATGREPNTEIGSVKRPKVPKIKGSYAAQAPPILAEKKPSWQVFEPVAR